MTLTTSPQAECKTCGKSFLRFRTTQAVCGPKCAAKSVKATKKAEAEKTRARRVALRSRRDWLEDTQKAVNAYVRARDAGKPCISCDAPWTETAQAGHFLSRGARPELRFELDNLAGQCVRCNLHLSGNLLGYRRGLVARIGLERVEALEGPHPPAKWSVDELRTMRDAFRLLAKQTIERQRETQELGPTTEPPEPESTAEPATCVQPHPKPLSDRPADA